MRLGRLDLTLLPDTPFRLDGGAMFGVVPRVLWERRKPADARHRIQMTTNCLLVASADELVLIDAGLGDKLDDKTLEIHAVPAGEPRLLDRLAAAGHRPEDVTQVILTHLHFDHCGWSTRHDGEHLVPTFPRARYWVERRELEHARRPNERDRVSYLPQNFEPLAEAAVLEVFEEEAEPAPGVRVVRAPGHTAGMCVVTLDGDGHERAIFLADLVPTAAHVPTPWVMGYDLFPVTTMESKTRWLTRVAEEGWLCIFEHDPETPAGRLVEERPGRFRVEPTAID